MEAVEENSIFVKNFRNWKKLVKTPQGAAGEAADKKYFLFFGKMFYFSKIVNLPSVTVERGA